MASNVDIKITADVVDLQAKFALAKAESNAFTSELSKLARQATKAGGDLSAEMKSGLADAANASLKAKAEVAELSAQLDKASHASTGFSGGLGLMKQGLAALGIVASVEAVKSFAEAVEESTAHLEHEANVLQLSVTAYQAFRQASIDSGVEADVADGAIRRFSKNVSEAAEGAGPAAKAFLEMGISTHQSKEAILAQVSAFMVHADAMTRDRIATEVFGRSGAELMPLFPLWAQGVDTLAQKYDSLGRMIDPHVTKAAEEADIRLQGAWEHLKAASAGPIATTTSALAGLLDVLTAIASTPTIKPGEGFFQGLARNFGFGGGGEGAQQGAGGPGARNLGNMERDPKTGEVKFVAPSLQEQIADLSQYDSKLRERTDLEKQLAAVKTIQANVDKPGSGASDKDKARAAEAVSDLQKQLDSLNKTKYGGGFSNAGEEAIVRARTSISEINANPTSSAADKNTSDQAVWQQLLNDARLNAAQRLQVQQELNRQIAAGNRAVTQEANAEARSDAQRDVALAKTAFDQKKSLLDEEFSAHRITAQQKFDATVQAVQEEIAAERAAVQQVIDSDATSAVEKHQAANEIVEINARMNAEIAQANKQLVQDLKSDDKERYEAQKEMLGEIEQAEGSLVSDILTKRQSLVVDLEQTGARFVQSEIENLLKVLTEHEMVNAGMIASDQARTQAGFLATMLGLGKQTAATVVAQGAQTGAAAAGEAARTGIHATGAAAGKAISTATATEEISKDAAQAAAGAYKALVGIPIIGPIIAPVAAGVAFAAVEAFGSFAQGVNVVPHDMIAQVHAGERIMPAADNRTLMSALGTIGGEHTKAGDMHLHYSPQINAPRGRSLQEHLDNEAVAMRGWFQQQVRDGYITVR